MVKQSYIRLSLSLSGYGNKYPSSGVISASSERTNSRSPSAVSLQSSSSESEINYKRLYDNEREENEKLTKKIKELEKRLASHTVLKENNKNEEISEVILSDKERRAFERKISELEEEAKAVELLRSDNQRLKEENASLIRVISKLSK